jgi:hypothetical protein
LKLTRFTFRKVHHIYVIIWKKKYCYIIVVVIVVVVVVVVVIIIIIIIINLVLKGLSVPYIATGYGLADRMIGVRFPARTRNSSLRHHVQTGCGAHPASYPMDIGGSFPGVKWPGREADHSTSI